MEKIEIVKGPSSSLYGSEAMAGVINIITRNPNPSRKLIASFRNNNTEHKIRNEGLINGSNNLNLSYIQPIEDFNIKLNLSTDKINTDKSIELIDIDQINKDFINASIDWKTVN